MPNLGGSLPPITLEQQRDRDQRDPTGLLEDGLCLEAKQQDHGQQKRHHRGRLELSRERLDGVGAV